MQEKLCKSLEKLFNSNLQEFEFVDSVKALSDTRFVIKLGYTDDNSTRKYIMELVEGTELACLYLVTSTTLLHNNKLITFERVGECVNYFTHDREGNFSRAKLEHVFKQVEVEL